MSPRKALAPSAESFEQRAANRAGGNRAKPGVTPERGDTEVSRTFLIIGRHKIAGHKPGQEIELTLTQNEIDALIEAGHVREVQPKKAEPVKVTPEKAIEKKGLSNG